MANTALITGASRGIGRGVALRLAELGFDVIATMRRPEMGDDLPEQAADFKGSLRVARLDVTEAESMAIPSGLNVLVNNAAVEFPFAPLEHVPMEQWRAALETNVFGPIELMRQAIPEMRRNGGGVICNILSCSVVMGLPFYSVYRAGKCALGAISETLRAELAPFNIRVFDVLPGPVATEMFHQTHQDPVDFSAFPSYEVMMNSWSDSRAAIPPELIDSINYAAQVICDALMSDNPPLKVPIGVLAEGFLDQWSKSPLAALDPEDLEPPGATSGAVK